MLVVDTSVASRDPVEHWVNASRTAYQPFTLHAPRPDAFRGRLWSDVGPSFEVCRIVTTASTLSRSADDIAAADSDLLHLHLLAKGRLECAQQGRSARLGPGDLTSYDTSQPVILRAPEPFDLIVLRLPKALLGPATERILQLTATRIPARTGYASVATGLLHGLVQAATDGNLAQVGTWMSDVIVDLLRRMYSDVSPPTSSRCELRLRAQTYIEEHLSDPALRSAEVAHACAASRRLLEYAFADDGMTVGGWIRDQRLQRCRRDLVDVHLLDEPIAAISARWGLASASTFHRSFTAAFGCSPSEIRKMADQARAQQRSGAHDSVAIAQHAQM